MNLLFIANPKSGTAKQKLSWTTLRAWLPADVTADWVSTSYPGNATEIARQAVEGGVYDRIVAIGGDGTINEVAQGLQHTAFPLCIIPVGSGNGVARHFGLPLDAQKALHTAIHGFARQIDAGRFNGHLFLCTAGVGLDGVVAKEFSNSKTRGFWEYVRIANRSFFNTRPIQYSGQMDGHDTKAAKARMLTIANCNQYGNNVKIAPGADASDGWLNVVQVKAFYPIFLPWFAAKSLLGWRIQQDATSSISLAKKGRFVLDKASEAHIDGEWIGSVNELTFEVEPLSMWLVSA